MAGRLYRSPATSSIVQSQSTFAVFIPAYKEDGIIVEVAQEALKQSYPQDKYEVVVIADSLQPETLVSLRNLPITVVEVSFEKSTKVKALNKALDLLKGKYDHAVILDADNVMEFNFLEILNNLHNQGYRAIQGRRAAKNKNNSLSLLDGLSEEINNHMLGKGSSALGLSAALKGSGMSFDYDQLRIELAKMESVGGFDRELELRLVNQNTRVKYAHNVVVFDEKVEKSEVFENQRKRWISSQFFYLKRYLFPGVIGFFKGKFAYCNSTVLRNIQLPRLINLGLLTVLTIISILGSLIVPTLYEIWIAIALITYLSTALAIPNEYYGKPLLQAVFSLPKIFLKMFALLFKLKGANKKFIHTPHTSSRNKN
ncbi:glycosyltransferase [Fulvivirga sp. RKSG066]|nr:glycosyltransferase [Fulvivirga aurantia]